MSGNKMAIRYAWADSIVQALRMCEKEDQKENHKQDRQCMLDRLAQRTPRKRSKNVILFRINREPIYDVQEPPSPKPHVE